MFLVEPVIDSLRIVNDSIVAAFYADMMEKQQTQFNILLVAIGLIVAAVIGATWWWNYKGSKAQITEEIQTGLKRYQRLFNVHRASMEEAVDKRVNEKMSALSSSTKKELESYKEDLSRDNKKMNANLHRLFALHCSSIKSYFNGASWWLSAFDAYKSVNDGEFEQICIEAYVEALGECYRDETLSEDQLESIPEMIKDAGKIPDVFARERNKAKSLLKQIADKAKKEKEKE